MLEDPTVFRAAALIILKHGDDAAFHAESRAQSLSRQGDRTGAAIWKRIARLTEEMLSLPTEALRAN